MTTTPNADKLIADAPEQIVADEAKAVRYNKIKKNLIAVGAGLAAGFVVFTALTAINEKAESTEEIDD